MFSHFWTDGIFESGANLEEISSRRRRIFYAIGDVLRADGKDLKNMIVRHDILKSLGSAEIESEIRDLERRGVVKIHDHSVDFRVRLFQEWLVASGSQKLLTNLDIEEDVRADRSRIEALTVQSAEIAALTDKWIYQGKATQIELVRSWLQQFSPDAYDQRCIFTMLSALKFYSQDIVRARVKTAFNMIAREYQSIKDDFEIRRDEYVVTYLDDADKSGAYMAKLFSEENRLHVGSVIEKSSLRQFLIENGSKKKCVIAIDDFMGTGDSLLRFSKDVWAKIGSVVQQRRLDSYVVVVAAFESAFDKVRNSLNEDNIPILVRACDLFGDEIRAFADGNAIFSDLAQRDRAESLARRAGTTLLSKAPLGYGDQGALIAFEHNIPNNSLPVLWKQSKRWRPLFPRS